MDLSTNSASTQDWLRASQHMRISAHDPNEKEPLSMASPPPPASQVLDPPKLDPSSQPPSQE
jgi:hypothetical protein